MLLLSRRIVCHRIVRSVLRGIWLWWEILRIRGILGVVGGLWLGVLQLLVVVCGISVWVVSLHDCGICELERRRGGAVRIA